MPNYVPGIGPFEPDLMAIGESPGKHENDQGTPFVEYAPTGRIVTELLTAAGIPRGEVYLTNVVKYQPPFNDFKKLDLIGVDLQDSIAKLWDDEIRKLRPKCILAIGDEALHAVTGLRGIHNYRGSILTAIDGKTKVVPTIHPGALFPKPGSETGALPWVYKKIIASDFERAVNESKTRSLDLPHRDTVIAYNSLDLFRFKRQYSLLRRATADIESINCIPVCISFAFNNHHSITVPLLRKIGNHPLTDMGESELAECWKIVQEMLLELDLVGQNFKYDEYKLSLARFRIGRVISDTLLKTHTIFPELPDKRLHVQSSLWTREPYYKEEGKEAKVGTKFNVERFFKYCGRDSCVTNEIDEEQEKDLIALGEHFKVPLKEFYYNFIMRKHKFYLKMENNGFKVDLPRKAELKSKYTDMHKIVHEKLTTLVGYEVNTKSNPQKYQLLYGAMKFPTRKKAPCSEDSIIALLGNHCKGKDGKIKEEILTTLLEDSRIRDQISRQINFIPDYDDRCKSSYKITGTETARSSTNILKKPIRPKKIGLAFHTISKHGRLAKDIRSMFIPDTGMVFIQIDLSQAEARIVAILAEDYDLLRAFDQVDIHRRTAALFFGLTSTLDLRPIELGVVDYLEKDGAERFTGKMFRHAGNYDMGKGRAMNEFNVNAQKYEINTSISEWKAGQFIELFHKASPKIRGVFHRDIKRCIDSNRSLVNPYGRPRVFNGRYDDSLYKEAYAYIPQSTVADTLFSGAIAASDEFGEDTPAMFLSENHDALTLQVPKGNWESYAKVIKKCTTIPIDFSKYCSLVRDVRLTIPVDVEYSETHYADFKKVKLVV